MTFTISTEMFVEHCYKCGVPFAVTKSFHDDRYRDCKIFYCPKGHSQVYDAAQKPESKASEPTPFELELRRTLILKLHHEEQDEARAAEGKPAAADAENPDPTQGPEVVHSRPVCGHCGKVCRSAGWLNYHLCARHNVTA